VKFFRYFTLSATARFFHERIATILVVGTFILIGGILFFHFFIINSFTNQMNQKLNQANSTPEQIGIVFRDVNNANLNIFSIVLSLFGAWVGAVLAFYFGSQSIDKAYSSLSQAQDSINKLVSDNKLAGIKVKETIEKNPSSKDFKKFKMDAKVKEIIANPVDKYPCVMITDDSEKKPLGLLFISDLPVQDSKSTLSTVDKSLKDYLKDVTITDFITKDKWSPEGVQNFAIVNMDNSLKEVVEKMKKIKDSLSVRAVVIEKDVPIAIITHDMISKELEK
jgi:hypothetical protein